MIEERKPNYLTELERQAEVLFKEEVQRALVNDPSAGIRPLKFTPGTPALVSGQPEEGEIMVKIIKGKAGVYLAHQDNGDNTYTTVICSENLMKQVN